MDIKLQHWSDDYRQPFADMNADPDVMADLGGPLELAGSNLKFDRYRDAWQTDGISRWAVVDAGGTFLGYSGVRKAGGSDHPLGVHFEIGWRLKRDAWGKGYATISAQRALHHAWTILDINEIFSYTAADNSRSQAVMVRLGLQRDTARDFTARYSMRDWTGLVWRADRPLT